MSISLRSSSRELFFNSFSAMITEFSECRDEVKPVDVNSLMQVLHFPYPLVYLMICFFIYSRIWFYLNEK